MAASCGDDDDGEARTHAEDVTVTEPEVSPVASGDLRVRARFAWNACGEQACFALEKRRHGGPDVFGIRFDPEPQLTVTHAILTLRSSCGEEISVSDGLVGRHGVFFVVQDTTGKGGDGCRGDFDRVYNMAAGTLELLVQPPADCGGKNLFFDTMFGHSYNAGGSNVTIDPDSDEGPEINWGDDSADQFTVVTNEGGVFNCAGARGA